MADSATDLSYLIWLSATALHFNNYVATIPCDVSLIACFLALIFHKIVWQHTQGIAGFLITILLQIYQKMSQ